VSFLYPRRISVHRVRTNAVVNGQDKIGGIGYAGVERETDPADVAGEQVLFKGICCSIQAHQAGRTKDTPLPTDITSKPLWLIIIPASQLQQYSVRDRDIIVDDEGYRYGVQQNWWTGLSYNLTCVRLEA
jgi:hypothetical protein